MTIERKVKKIKQGDGKWKSVAFYVDAETGAKFDKKPERKKHAHKKVGSLRNKRSDAKSINATNCIFVARKAIEAHLAAGESLTPMMEDFLKAWDDYMFLMVKCQPSIGMLNDQRKLSRKLAGLLLKEMNITDARTYTMDGNYELRSRKHAAASEELHGFVLPMRELREEVVLELPEAGSVDSVAKISGTQVGYCAAANDEVLIRIEDNPMSVAFKGFKYA